MREGLRLLVLLAISSPGRIFSFAPIHDSKKIPTASNLCTKISERWTLSSLKMNRRMLDDDDGDDDDFEFARVRRRRGRASDEYDGGRERSSSATKDQRDGGTRRQYDDDYDEIDFENDDEYDSDGEDEYLDDYEDDEEDDYDEIIPNAFLDQIDPDGAIDRLPELFADKKFWKDSAIWFLLGFVYLLNRFNNPMLNGVVDLDKVDFSQFYQ
jgi:hypothetical protein